jgi:solute carrier family 25 carnitine/acylcarnitine transporter 20/29
MADRNATFVVRDFAAGWISGGASVVVGQPFDTVKVRVQTKVGRVCAVRVLLETVQCEGLGALFKGTLAPMMAVSMINAVVFAAKGSVLGVLHPPGSALGPPPLSAEFLSGSVAGIAAAIPGTPAELVKCRLQVQAGRGAGQRYAGNIDCIRQIVTCDGLAGVYRGHTIMCLRESLAFGVYFSTYAGVKRRLSVWGGMGNAQVQMSAGAITGAVTW